MKAPTLNTTPEALARPVPSAFGSWMGARTQRFRPPNAEVLEKAAALEKAALRVYRNASEPAQLASETRMRDDTCYLLRNEWHAGAQDDRSIDALLPHAPAKVLEAARFWRITTHTVSIAP